jgi:hypothetical protein
MIKNIFKLLVILNVDGLFFFVFKVVSVLILVIVVLHFVELVKLVAATPSSRGDATGTI